MKALVVDAGCVFARSFRPLLPVFALLLALVAAVSPSFAQVTLPETVDFEEYITAGVAAFVVILGAVLAVYMAIWAVSRGWKWFRRAG
jgi:hypothetical protein